MGLLGNPELVEVRLSTDRRITVASDCFSVGPGNSPRGDGQVPGPDTDGFYRERTSPPFRRHRPLDYLTKRRRDTALLNPSASENWRM